MGVLEKAVLGGMTVATLATGQVNAAETQNNSSEVNDAAKKEIVVTPQDTANINSASTLDLSDLFYSVDATQNTKAPGTLENLQKDLSSPTNLTQEQIWNLSSWTNYLLDNPQDALAKDAFKEIKQAALETTNKWVKMDIYYEQANIAGSYDQIKESQKHLNYVMDKLVSNKDVRDNIVEANVRYGSNIATNFATLRLYEQCQTLDFVEKHPQMLNDLVRQLNCGNKQEETAAKNTIVSFYEKNGLNLVDCHKGVARNSVLIEYNLSNNEKEQVYMYCLHRAMDKQFAQLNNIAYNIDFACINDKTYMIPGDVALTLEHYAAYSVAKSRGKKLTKDQEKFLDSAPSDIRNAHDAYFRRCNKQFIELMNRPEGEYVVFTNTNGAIDYAATTYVNFQRLGKKRTSEDDMTMAGIIAERSDLKIAENYYKEYLARHTHQSTATLLAQNVATR